MGMTARLALSFAAGLLAVPALNGLVALLAVASVLLGAPL